MPRADALRNRDRLLDAAAGAFAAAAATGEEVTLQRVAHDAGVGIATLYRHFPTREALVEAVYRAELATLCATAPAGPDAATALRAWLDRYADFVLTKRGMADTLRAMVADGTLASSRTRESIGAVVQSFLTAGVADGSLRPGVAADDVVVLMLGALSAVQGLGAPARVAALLDLVVAAVRA